MRTLDRKRAVIALVLMVAIGAGAWYAPELAAQLHQRYQIAVSLHPTLVDCPLPGEFETLHITVVRRAGNISAGCMYVGSRGSYTRRSVRQAAAQ